MQFFHIDYSLQREYKWPQWPFIISDSRRDPSWVMRYSHRQMNLRFILCFWVFLCIKMVLLMVPASNYIEKLPTLLLDLWALRNWKNMNPNRKYFNFHEARICDFCLFFPVTTKNKQKLQNLASWKLELLRDDEFSIPQFLQLK